MGSGRSISLSPIVGGRSARIYALAGLRVEALKVLWAPRMEGELPRGGADYIIYTVSAKSLFEIGNVTDQGQT